VSLRIPLLALLAAAAPTGADVVVTTLSGTSVRGISLTADARDVSVHAASGQVVKVPAQEVVDIVAVPAPPWAPEATRPFEVELVDGSRLRGVPEAGPEGALRLRTPVLREGGGHVDLPIEILREMRRVAGAEVPGASRLVRIAGKDAAYRLGGGRVEGILARFTATSVEVEREDLAPVSIPYGDLAAVFADNAPAPAPKGLQVVARMADGSAVLLQRDFQVARGTLQGTTPSGLGVRAAASQLVALGFQGESFVHLSDVPPASVKREPFFPIPEGPAQAAMLDFVCPVRIDRSPDGRDIALLGTRYFKGIGVRPRTAITWELGGAYAAFQATCGIDDEVLGPSYGRGAGTGSVVFQVDVDGKRVFESPPVQGGREPANVRADLRGAKTLTLTVAFVPAALTPKGLPDSPELDNAVWARPLLIR
jgi:hypothetical protein